MTPNPNPPLLPLRIPSGWEVTWNVFCEVDPNFEESHTGAVGFTENMLQIVNKQTSILIDLGWYPEGDPKGQFRLVAIRTDGTDAEQTSARDRPLNVLTSRSKSCPDGDDSSSSRRSPSPSGTVSPCSA